MPFVIASVNKMSFLLKSFLQQCNVWGILRQLIRFFLLLLLQACTGNRKSWSAKAFSYDRTLEEDELGFFGSIPRDCSCFSLFVFQPTQEVQYTVIFIVDCFDQFSQTPSPTALLLHQTWGRHLQKFSLVFPYKLSFFTEVIPSFHIQKAKYRLSLHYLKLVHCIN